MVIKNPFRKQKKRKIELKVVKKYKGNTFYEYLNHLELPAQRAFAAEIATKEADMNLTAEKLDQLIDICIEYGEKGKIVDLFSILTEIKHRLRYVAEEETMLNLACVYFVMNDEDETKYLSLEQQRKRDIINSDEELKGFFLQKAYEYTMGYSDTSKVDIITFLKQNVVNLSKLENYLPKK